MPDFEQGSHDSQPDPAGHGADLDSTDNIARDELDGQPVEQESPQEPPQPGRKRTVALSIVLVVLVLLGAGIAGYVQSTGGFRDLFRGTFAPNLTEVFGKQKLRVLVMGVDDSWTNGDEVYTSASRSDTNIAVNIDLTSKNIAVLSIPRDIWVDIPKVGYAKLNEAIADAGPERTEATLTKNLGMPAFDYYLVLKIDATKNIVDAIGGVDVNVEKTMDYDDNWGHLHIHLKKGYQHLNGEQAVGYIRFRHDEEGDFGRMRRQRQVMQVLVARVKDPSIAMHIPALLSIVQKNVRTNIPADKMLALAFALRDITPQMVHTAEVPTDIGFTSGQSVLYFQPQTGADIIRKYLVVGFTGQFDPSTVRLKVENGSGKPGAATAMADFLRQKGFTVIETRNAKKFGVTETSITGPNGTIVALVAKQMPVTKVLTAIGLVEGGDIDIVVGKDYRI
ncbi:MAG TPA: LCP family protein [Candidatus Eremiobacteraceae bacterium]|nr:LCP family protein [Candidatus Eremiobacteraceae bacterium]